MDERSAIFSCRSDKTSLSSSTIAKVSGGSTETYTRGLRNSSKPNLNIGLRSSAESLSHSSLHLMRRLLSSISRTHCEVNSVDVPSRQRSPEKSASSVCGSSRWDQQMDLEKQTRGLGIFVSIPCTGTVHFPRVPCITYELRAFFESA